MVGNASPWGCNIWDLNSRKEPVMWKSEKWAFLEGKAAITITKRKKKNKGSGGSDISVLAYGSGFKAYPPSPHFPLIFCLRPCHWNQMINGTFYGYSGKYIISDFYWAWSTESMPFQSPGFWWRNIVIYSK